MIHAASTTPRVPPVAQVQQIGPTVTRDPAFQTPTMPTRPAPVATAPSPEPGVSPAVAVAAVAGVGIVTLTGIALLVYLAGR